MTGDATFSLLKRCTIYDELVENPSLWIWESVRRGLLLGVALLAATAGGDRPAWAAEIPEEGQVRVLLASGRHFTAEIDRRTDATTLWLRWGQETGVILRPIDWGRVVQVEIAGETFPAASFVKR